MSDLRDSYELFWTDVREHLMKHGYLTGPNTGEWDEQTEKALIRFKQDRGFRGRSLIGPGTLDMLLAEPLQLQTDVPSWLKMAMSYIGEKEIPGPRHNPIITNFWKLIGASWYTDDETPWCGAFIGAMLLLDNRESLPGHLAPRALAWEKYGGKLYGPRVGAIATKERHGGGHVFMVLGRDVKNNIIGIGGNQNNKVSIGKFLPSEITAYRWPIPQEAKTFSPTDFLDLPIVDDKGVYEFVTEA